MTDEQVRERARMALEDAVYKMIEAGYTTADIRSEFEYALETLDD